MLLCRIRQLYFLANQMKKIFLILSLTFLPLLFATNAFADVICQPVYGGGQSCITTGNVIVNKLVQNPQTGQLVNNLGTSTPFSPGQTVTFQISLTNTGQQTIPQTAIKDTFPGFVNFEPGGTAGIFDANTKTLTFTADLLGPNETRNFTVIGKVVDTKDLPNGITCVVNQVKATTNTGQMSQDNAQFCIQKAMATTKGGLPIVSPSPITTTPPTGPEMLPLMALLPGGLAGFLLRKKSKNDFKGGEK